jgi:hypothetical protein
MGVQVSLSIVEWMRERYWRWQVSKVFPLNWMSEEEVKGGLSLN